MSYPIPGTGRLSSPPPGYAPPALPGVAAGSPNIFRGRLVLVYGPSGAATGVFVYQAGTTPAAGNPPIFWATSGTTDPFGNPLPSTVGVGGAGTFQAGNTIITPAGEFIYQASTTPGPGNPPIFWATSGATDPFGNALPSAVGVAGVGEFQAGDTIITPAGLFVYSGTPSSANLIASIAPLAGTDPFATAVPAGIGIEQGGLVLYNQTPAPPAVAGASSFYGASGRPRLLSSSGNDSVLERSFCDQTNVAMQNQTTTTVVSGPMQIRANEAVVGSEFELEITGGIWTPTVDTAFTFRLYRTSPSVQLGPDIVLGAVMLTHGQQFAYTIRWMMGVTATGASGTCDVYIDGGVARRGVGFGNIQASGGMTASPIQEIATSNGFDTTLTRTYFIFGFWAAANTGGLCTTYRTKVARRN